MTAPGTPLPTNTPALATSFAGGIPFGMFAQPVETSGPGTTAPCGTSRRTCCSTSSRHQEPRRADRADAGRQSSPTTSTPTAPSASPSGRSGSTGTVRRLSSYINDGTIIAHYLMDEPYDPANFAGEADPGRHARRDGPVQQVDLAQPGHRGAGGAVSHQVEGPYQYLDAAWAQYRRARAIPTTTSRRTWPLQSRWASVWSSGLNLTTAALRTTPACPPAKSNPSGRPCSAVLIPAPSSAGSMTRNTCPPPAWAPRWTRCGRRPRTARPRAARTAARTSPPRPRSPAAAADGGAAAAARRRRRPRPCRSAMASATGHRVERVGFKATPSNLVYRLNTAGDGPRPADRDAGEHAAGQEQPTAPSTSASGRLRWTSSAGSRSPDAHHEPDVLPPLPGGSAELRLVLGRHGDSLGHGGGDGAGTASRSGQVWQPWSGRRPASWPRPPSGGTISTQAGPSTTPGWATSGPIWPARWPRPGTKGSGSWRGST